MMMAGIQSDEKEKEAAEMELRDGHYLLSVFVSTPGTTLSIAVEHKTDGARWRGDFTSSYIMDMTQRAGNARSFSNFVKMLRCATATDTSSSSNRSLHVDVLTYQDLEMLQKDGRNNGAKDKEYSSHSSLSNVAAASDKRYLILSYITEFYRVHYPLPLLLEGEAVPEETATIRCYQRLHIELESMKARLKEYESPQHTNFQQRLSTNSRAETRAESSIASYIRENENRNNSPTETRFCDRGGTSLETVCIRTPQLQTPESVRALQNKVSALEDKLRTEAAAHKNSIVRALQSKVRGLEDKLRTEAAAHKNSITALARKNTLLEDAARKARVAERRMSEKLRDNELQIGLLRGRLRLLNRSNGGGGARSNSASPFRTRPSQRTPESPPILGRYLHQGRLRPSSTPATTRSRHTDKGQLRWPSPASLTSGRHIPAYGPFSLPSRSCTSSPVYSRHLTTPPRLRTLASSPSSWPTSSSSRVRRKGAEIDDWLQQASMPKRCATPPSSATRTTPPRRVYEGRSHEQFNCTSGNRSRGEVTEAASEVGEIDYRLHALQDYLKRRNA